MKRAKDRQMKDAKLLILKDIDQNMIDSTEFNSEMLTRHKCKKMLGFYEARKLDVLSILSNPFNNQFNNKGNFVLKLAIEQAKIEDQIWDDYKVEFNLFIKACNFYGMMKTGNNNDLTKDAKVIKHNVASAVPSSSLKKPKA